MSDSDGRRIKRSLLIRPSSIRFLSENEINNLRNIDIIKNFIDIRQKEIVNYNSSNKTNKDLMINGRNMTNLGIFRRYAETYLEKHPLINKDMMIMCRQLDPTSQGIPVEVYVFSKDKDWKKYEHLMSDIFDHLLASVNFFKLECFELSYNYSNLRGK